LRTTNTKMRLIFAIAAAFDILNIIGIFVWFFLQHNLNLIADDILHFNIAASLIDVVGVSAFRAVLILILYVIIAIDTLMPLIGIFSVSFAFALAKISVFFFVSHQRDVIYYALPVLLALIGLGQLLLIVLRIFKISDHYEIDEKSPLLINSVQRLPLNQSTLNSKK